ncbi:MAG TPA: alpha/beta hydrolase [Planctomycetota bacterium]|nr:alpha/beta hydrolase [Planctomycetota bacterium]
MKLDPSLRGDRGVHDRLWSALSAGIASSKPTTPCARNRPVGMQALSGRRTTSDHCIRVAAVCLLALALLSSCACPLSGVEPPTEFAGLLLPGQTEAVPVVYATNRKPLTEPPDADPCEHGWYGPDRNSEVLTGLAIAEVTAFGKALYPFVSSVSERNESTGELVTRSMNLHGSEALIYVHGFSTTFQEGIATAALLGRLLDASIIPIAFSWPAGVPTIWIGSAYLAERESADLSVPAFKDMLRELCSTEGLSRVHLVGHSTGCWLICRALEELAMEGNPLGMGPGRIGEVILAAADIDLDVFKTRFLPHVHKPLADRISIYINLDDHVLGISSILRASVAPRIGQIDLSDSSHGIATSGIELIDVTRVRNKPNMGHSYLISSQPVCRDVIAILKGATGEMRNLTPGPAPHSFIMEDDEPDTTPSDTRFYHGPRGR